jgi:hypothetical protein
MMPVIAMPMFHSAGSEITRFKDRHPEGNVIEYWRLTHDPAVWDHANCYHTDCFSLDGRYVCYEHHSSPNEVHIVELQTGRDIEIGKGQSPRWANQHNWLFFTRSNPGGGKPWNKGTEVLRYDCDTGETQLITWGMRPLGSTDCDDRWIFGNQVLRHEDNGATYQRTVRARIAPESPLEIIYENQFVLAPRCNPRHEVIFMRDNERESIFGAARVWLDLDGSNERIGVPLIQRAHINWSGDGKWQLIGDGPPQFPQVE